MNVRTVWWVLTVAQFACIAALLALAIWGAKGRVELEKCHAAQAVRR